MLFQKTGDVVGMTNTSIKFEYVKVQKSQPQKPCDSTD